MMTSNIWTLMAPFRIHTFDAARINPGSLSWFLLMGVKWWAFTGTGVCSSFGKREIPHKFDGINLLSSFWFWSRLQTAAEIKETQATKFMSEQATGMGLVHSQEIRAEAAWLQGLKSVSFQYWFSLWCSCWVCLCMRERQREPKLDCRVSCIDRIQQQMKSPTLLVKVCGLNALWQRGPF